MNSPTPKRRIEDARPELSLASSAQRRDALYLALAGIPAGRVVSYGQLAEMSGVPRGARWAAQTLSRLPQGTSLPWHRVITASGRPGLDADCPSGVEQRLRLRNEGVCLTNDRVNMRQHGWHPTPLNG